MRVFAALSSVFLLQIGAVLCQSATLSSSADILFWPVTSSSSSKPSLLAKIEYDSKTLDTNVLSYTPPAAAGSSNDNKNGQEEDLVRVGFFVDTPASPKQWVGSLISQSALATQRQKLHLYLGGATEQPYHVSLSPHFNQSSTDALDVELVFSKPGPLPELNKPVVINPDGTNTEVVEKTLFQKYWWVFLVVTFLAMSGGGGGGEGQQ
ncbi:uncharacterized protein TRUGW13939_02021 [Talaromyces rugulosus]|uniref:ER membrane protein complex subunit 10 n=1 Tax=Talaromyces rugulosus TaxID=121627 RepID=A0A7H8QN08_TALRU|nr:uncharacterized protein TRUGW13939_02021 [Talaromyces rugulosus]QKX54931.1 hypothetical protein TRUGW13939_02021 [Talaromyces rugulosus]